MTFKKPYTDYEGQWISNSSHLIIYLVRYLETHTDSMELLEIEHIRFLTVIFDSGDISLRKFWIDNGEKSNNLMLYFPIDEKLHEVISAII